MIFRPHRRPCKHTLRNTRRPLTSCDCPAHIFRRHRRPCKHTLALLDAVSVVKEWEAANPGKKLMESGR